jgi:tRNA A-37 threonylcarbamoyl transferase component Bud32
LIQKLAVYTRFMHDQKFVHHDYFWRNIILEGGGLDHFYLIDAHKGFPWKGSKDFRWRIADLACLDSAAPSFFRRTERLRFFLRYRNRSSLHPEDKKLIGRILGLAAPMRSRQLKRVRQSPGVEPSGSSPTDSAGDPDLPHG